MGLTASSTDINGTLLGAGVTYSLSDNAGGRFTIDASSGVVTVADASLLNYEDASSHDITVEASDGLATVSQTFTITLTNVPPTALVDDDATANEVPEDAGIGDYVGITAVSTDVNGTLSGGSVTYSLIDNAGGRFSIDADDGEIRVADDLDYENASSHEVTVRASDGFASVTETFTIHVLDVNLGLIHGQVWVDDNGNGEKESEDARFSGGMVVELFDAAWALVATTTTDGTGTYAFMSIAPGDYYVVFRQVNGYDWTLPGTDSDVAPDENIPVDPDTIDPDAATALFALIGDGT